MHYSPREEVEISIFAVDEGSPQQSTHPDTSHGHSHLSTLPYSLLRGQGRQADWLSTKKYLSVLSFSLSKVEPHPPQPQTKQVFYINPIATPRFQNTTSKVRFFFPSFIYPSSLPAHPPAPVCPRNVPSTLPNINVPMTLSHHSSTGSIERQNWWVKSKANVKCLLNGTIQKNCTNVFT